MIRPQEKSLLQEKRSPDRNGRIELELTPSPVRRAKYVAHP
ncbi:hypothetical protein [Egbenema bharatensis]